MAMKTIDVSGKDAPLDKIFVFEHTALIYYVTESDLAEAISLAISHFGMVYEKHLDIKPLPGSVIGKTILMFPPTKKEE